MVDGAAAVPSLYRATNKNKTNLYLTLELPQTRFSEATPGQGRTSIS